MIAAAIGAVFSSILPNFTNILPSWWGVYGWFFGVAIGGAVYYALVKARGAPSSAHSPRGGIRELRRAGNEFRPALSVRL